MPVKIVAVDFETNSLQDRLAIVGANMVTCWYPNGDGLIKESDCFVHDNGEENFYAVGWAKSTGPQAQSVIVAGGLLGDIQVIYANDLSLVKTLPGHSLPVNDIVSHPKYPSYILSASTDRTIRMWCVAKGVCLQMLANDMDEQMFWSLAEPNHPNRVIGSGEKKQITSWYTEAFAGKNQSSYGSKDYKFGTDRPRQYYQIGRTNDPPRTSSYNRPAYVDCSRYIDETCVLSLERDVGITLWKSTTYDKTDEKTVLGFLDIPDYGTSKAMMGNGSKIIAIGNKLGKVYVLDFTKLQEPKLLALLSDDSSYAITHTTITADGGYIASINEEDGIASIWISKEEQQKEKEKEQATGPTQKTDRRELAKDPEREKMVNMAIGRFLSEIGADFDAASSVHFKTWVDEAVSGKFGLPLPAYEGLRCLLLKSCVGEMEKYIEECRLMWKKKGCSLLVQESNSDQGRKFLNFLVYCPRNSVFLKSVAASPMFLASEDKLLELLKTVVEEVGVANVVQVVTKWEDHYVSAGARLMKEYPSLYWVPCASHCIDKMLGEIGEIGWISEIIKSAQAVTKFIYNHSGVLNLMRKLTLGTDIVKPDCSSSTTSFVTIARMVELKPKLQDMVKDEFWNEVGGSSSSSAAESINSESFWEKLTMANQITGPLLNVLRVVDSARKPAMGLVHAALYRAKVAFKKHRASDYTNYWKIIDKWWYQGVPLYAVGFYLNPNFSRKLDKISDAVKKLESDYEENNEAKDKDAVQKIGSSFLAEWASIHGFSCGKLSPFAIRLLSQTCSSLIGSVRIPTLYESKNSIERRRLSYIVFVQYNMRLKSLGRRSGDGYVDPLSHSNMGVLEDWISDWELDGDGISDWMSGSDWKSLDSIEITEELKVIDETDLDSGEGFYDEEIFKLSDGSLKA
ncbi:unnamed protein product [Microthlaspi erraticum]|uniref:DUF659 domain-containing protein n=1 Tax=Microthlaspi erraticum TaxID=1685480 RepID=A0A6D2HKA4_9BRAS|nr:unnamed protein product [Microthlaspi erraticum]